MPDSARQVPPRLRIKLNEKMGDNDKEVMDYIPVVEKYISGHEIENISLHARLHSAEEIADDLFR